MFFAVSLLVVLNSCQKETVANLTNDENASSKNEKRVLKNDVSITKEPVYGAKVDPVGAGGDITDITMDPGDLAGGDPGGGSISSGDYYYGASNCLGGNFDVTHDGGSLLYNVNFSLDQASSTYVINNFKVTTPKVTATLSYTIVSKSLTFDMSSQKATIKIVYEQTQKVTYYDPKSGKNVTSTNKTLLNHYDVIDICNNQVFLG